MDFEFVQNPQAEMDQEGNRGTTFSEDFNSIKDNILKKAATLGLADSGQEEEKKKEYYGEDGDLDAFAERMMKGMVEKNFNEELLHKYSIGEVQANRHAATLVVATANKLLTGLIQVLQDIIEKCKENDNEMLTIENVKTIFIASQKVYSLDYVFYISFLASKDDIFYQDPEGPQWQMLNQYFYCVEFATVCKVLDAYERIFHLFTLSNAVLSKHKPDEKPILNIIKKGFYYTYFILSKKTRLLQHEMFLSNPDLELARTVWNLSANQNVNKMMEFGIPSILIN